MPARSGSGRGGDFRIGPWAGMGLGLVTGNGSSLWMFMVFSWLFSAMRKGFLAASFTRPTIPTFLLFALLVAALFMVFHDSTRSDFLRTPPVSARFLSAFLDVFILALFLSSYSA